MRQKIKLIGSLLGNIRQLFISYLPGPVGDQLRYNFWKRKLKYLGKNVIIDTGVYFQNPEFIHIDDNCWIDKNVMIVAGLDESEREKVTLSIRDFKGNAGVVFIGKNAHIAPNCIISGISAGVYISDNCSLSASCKLFSFSHHYKSQINPMNTQIYFSPFVPPENQCIIQGPIYLGMNTGVALNSIILPGVSISGDSFVAINSVVFPGEYINNSFIAGNPAKRIRTRFETNE